MSTRKRIVILGGGFAGLYAALYLDRTVARLPACLAFLALLATLRFPANKSWRTAAHTAGVLGLLIGVQFALAFVSHGGVHNLLPPSLVSAGQSR